MATPLDEVIRKFAQIVAPMQDTTNAVGECYNQSVWFAQFAADNGYRPVLVRCEERVSEWPDGCAKIWTRANPADVHHYVVRIGAKTIDWTARQFDPACEFPAIGKVRDLSCDWRLVDDYSRYTRTGEKVHIHTFQKEAA